MLQEKRKRMKATFMRFRFFRAVFQCSLASADGSAVSRKQALRRLPVVISRDRQHAQRLLPLMMPEDGCYLAFD